MKEEERRQSSSIVISVSDPEVKKEYGGAKQYYLYTIKGQDSKGPIDIQRRYSDFDSIRNLLIKRWPGCYIPSLPSKVKLAHSDEQFLQTRSKYLQKFLFEVSTRTFLWDSDEMQIFLRNNMMDFDKVIATFWKIEPMELLYRYGLHFKEIKGEEQQRMDEKIQEFNNYLTSLFVKVQQLRNRSEEINNAQSRYQKKYSKFLLNVLGTYEEKFLSYYNQNNKSFVPIFSSTESLQKKNELEESMKEAPLKILFEELKRQKREIFAIQQSIKGYEEYNKEKLRIEGKIKQHEVRIAELKNGKKSFFSKIRNVSTDDDIKSHEKSLEKYRTQLQNINEICAYIRRILFVSQIESFKKERTESYYKMVRQVAQEELKIIQKERQFWLAVCSNNNFDFDIEEKPQNNVKRGKVEPTKIEKEEQPKEGSQELQKEEESKIPSSKKVENVGKTSKSESRPHIQQKSASPKQNSTEQKEEQYAESVLKESSEENNEEHRPQVNKQTDLSSEKKQQAEEKEEETKEFSEFQQIKDEQQEK